MGIPHFLSALLPRRGQPALSHEKILLVGFPKSGTLSFQRLFTTLGYTSAHWKHRGRYIGSLMQANKRQGRKLLSGLEEVDCITQMDVCKSEQHSYWPQIVDFAQLYEEYSNALFILNKRNVHDLLSSFKGQKHLDRRLVRLNPELLQDAPGSTDDEKLLHFFRTHYENIESFFASRPEAKFLVYDLDTSTIQDLQGFIDIRGIAKFPHINKTN